MELGLYLTLYTKINFRGLVNLNVKSKTRKLLAGNIREYLHENPGQRCLNTNHKGKKSITWIKLGIYTSKDISNTHDKHRVKILK